MRHCSPDVVKSLGMEMTEGGYLLSPAFFVSLKTLTGGSTGHNLRPVKSVKFALCHAVTLFRDCMIG